jgi:lactate permease
MLYFLAMLPILLVLTLMIRLRWGAHKAGPAGWLAGLVIAGLWFGLTPRIFWVSQAKGLLLSLFVLGVMWPALFLYHWTDQNGGITGVARVLERAIPNRSMCLLLLAWSLSGLLEGLAGFGLPVAVVAPMLAALGVHPLKAVAAVAVGHSWAVTFGDMGVILQTLAAVVGMEVPQVVPWAALLLGVACLLCGLVSALILGELRHWPKVAGLALVMGGTQYGLATGGLLPLAAFGAGLAGMMVYWLSAGLQRARSSLPTGAEPGVPLWPEPTVRRDSAPVAAAVSTQVPAPATPGVLQNERTYETRQSVSSAPGLYQDESHPAVTRRATSESPALLALANYGTLTLVMAAFTMVPPLRATVQSMAWRPRFDRVESLTGFVTPAAQGQAFRPLAHPGTLILLVAFASILLVRYENRYALGTARRAAHATVRSAGAATIGIIFMVWLSTMMDHCGMSFLLAQGLSKVLGAAYPLVSPWVGILGAFATGSNNNSNVLFGSLQKTAAVLLGINPELMVATQTAGGSLGSMLAPAKIIVGCSTVGQVGQEGEVLRRTVPYGLVLGLAIGALTLLLSRLHL